MWFTFVTARLFIFLSFQPRLAATLLRSCSVVNSPTRRVGLCTHVQASFPGAGSVCSCSFFFGQGAGVFVGPATAGRPGVFVGDSLGGDGRCAVDAVHLR